MSRSVQANSRFGSKFSRTSHVPPSTWALHPSFTPCFQHSRCPQRVHYGENDQVSSANALAGVMKAVLNEVGSVGEI